MWYVDLEPTRGAEIRKTRPCIVVSTASAGTLALRLGVPLTGWHHGFDGKFWPVQIVAEVGGLAKDSTADTLQMRSVDILRFGARRGTSPLEVMSENTNALLLTLGYTPNAAREQGGTP